jgi:FAD/FMN-containing dehydrogenase
MDDARQSSSHETVIATHDLAQFRENFSGPIVVQADPGYNDARSVWNGMIDRYPAIVAQAASAADIAPAVQFARRLGLPLAVRSGGHSVAGNSTVDGGLVLDLSRLRRVSVDADARTVTVDAGVTLADIDRATALYNLAVPIGVVSSTGVAGLTLGGGIGWLTRPYGLTVDSLVSAEVVTVDGETLTASESENSELFWGLRGGGGNFGVVSSFTYRAYPLPERVFVGNFVYAEPRWRDALRAYAAWTRDLPDELTSIASFLVPPPAMELGDAPLLIMGFVWSGPDTETPAHLVETLRADASPDGDIVGPVPWVDWQSAVDGMFPRGARAYWKNTSFDELNDEVIDAIVRRASEQTWFGTGFDIHHLGGAFSQVEEDATPFPNRSARFWLNVYGFWTDAADDEARVRFVRGLADDMAPFSTGGQYVNFMAAETDIEPAAAALSVYGAKKLARLTALKRAYDPENVLRLNHNIAPE